MKRSRLIGLAIGFQVLILVGMVATSALPLWTGTEIKVKTIPVDPRDLFRGNYARLNYDFSRIPRPGIEHAELLRQGEIIYIRLAEADGLYQFQSSTLEKPTSGIFLRGRVEHNWFEQIEVQFGIEAFFAPKNKALQLESDLRGGGIATLMVSRNGRARIASVTPIP